MIRFNVQRHKGKLKNSFAHNISVSRQYPVKLLLRLALLLCISIFGIDQTGAYLQGSGNMPNNIIIWPPVKLKLKLSNALEVVKPLHVLAKSGE